MPVSKSKYAPFPPAPPLGAKRPYHAPQLVVFGDLRTVTLGPSPGIGESGNPALFKSV